MVVLADLDLSRGTAYFLAFRCATFQSGRSIDSTASACYAGILDDPKIGDSVD